jgi:hypothetical protein
MVFLTVHNLQYSDWAASRESWRVSSFHHRRARSHPFYFPTCSASNAPCQLPFDILTVRISFLSRSSPLQSLLCFMARPGKNLRLGLYRRKPGSSDFLISDGERAFLVRGVECGAIQPQQVIDTLNDISDRLQHGLPAIDVEQRFSHCGIPPIRRRSAKGTHAPLQKKSKAAEVLPPPAPFLRPVAVATAQHCAVSASAARQISSVADLRRRLVTRDHHQYHRRRLDVATNTEDPT